MTMTKLIHNRTTSPLCIFTHPLVRVTVLVFFILSGVLSSGITSMLLTSILLILSTLVFTFTKQKSVFVESPVKNEVLSSDGENQEGREDVLPEQHQEVKVVPQETETQDWSGMAELHDHVIRSPDFLSESESIDHSSTGGESEVDWSSPSNMGQIPGCSDDSISDDDSLIEIELPDGHYVGPKEEPKLRQTFNLPEFLPESVFRQQGLMELLAEINDMYEEENLIEIDISLGSIKYSRLEIEA
uniref:Uncharacterized protein n=1 Tax=Nelumbo nucifera TaxID=4432 RepID=A0A822XMP3_NELNU|nr:TPA_asm: hypothetical protein HUJ06_021689 [Nelumbo nucifera]